MDTDDDSTSKLPKVVEVSVSFQKGRKGRFDFETFLRKTGFEEFMKELSDDEHIKTKEEIRRIFNSLTIMWVRIELIKFVGYKIRKGQRGRKFKIYEPLDEVTFTVTVRMPENNNR